VHIAGSKGKGSTAAMIASVLTKAGYQNRAFIPHRTCISSTKRIQVTAF